MTASICPLCGRTEKCSKTHAGANGFVKYHCDTYDSDYSVSDDILNQTDHELQSKLFNLVVEQTIRSKTCKKDGHYSEWMYCYDPSIDAPDKLSPNQINLAAQMKNYPTRIVEVANRALINLSILHPKYGDEFSVFGRHRRLIFEEPVIASSNESGTMQMIMDMGLLAEKHHNSYVISAKGWEKIDALKDEELILKQGFIAMQFGEKTQSIRDAFKAAIAECGYSARVIDEKEHNNQIVPEILYEISRSKFAVVDITVPNYGAYYEAGYAQALGKEVIICCQNSVFHSKENRPHFDIAQKSMVLWEDEEDLVSRLVRRIMATVK